MKKHLVLAAMAHVLAALVTPGFAAVSEAKELPGGMQWAVDGGTLRVERLDGRRIDRIRYTPDPEEADHE